MLIVASGVLALALLLTLLGPGEAKAYTGINTFSTIPSDTQAGGHPDVEIHANFDNRVVKEGEFEAPEPGGCGCDDAETIDVHFPTGFIGNPHAVPRCTLTLFSAEECAPESQVGVMSLGGLFGQVPIYNMEPHENEPGLLGFNVPLLGAPSFIVLHGRTDSDYGLNATNSGIFHLLPINQVDIYMWGVPALPANDIHRFPIKQQSCLQKEYPEPCYPPVPSNSAPAPFLQNPTTCDTPLTAGLDIRYYDGTIEHADTPWASTTGCDQLSFNPSLAALPTTTQADTASGLDVDLRVPQDQSAFVPSPSQIRSTTVTLPEGMSINPNAADGKTSCTDADGSFGTELPAQCPEHAKVGTLQIDSSALPGPIDGAIYLGEPLPGDTYRLFLTASGFATHVKLAGSVHPDPKTGQIVVSFEDLPQTPLQRFTMHFFGSERGLLATPPHCGTYPVRSKFVPWNSVLPDQEALSFFEVKSGPGGTPCPPPERPFSPTLKAGTADNTSGVHTPFALKLSRPDGHQTVTSVNVSTPPGFSATLAGVPYCPEPAIAKMADPSHTGSTELATPSCPIASQIGSAVIGSGAGTRPLHTTGRVFLAGPYGGAPLSLVVVIPAVSGPYDLGTVAVRSAINVDPATAQVSTVSDQLPQILDGIPLRLRTILVSLDRPNFTLNPTNCNPFAVGAEAFGGQGAVANPSNHFQVANCDNLDFGPRLSLQLRGSTKRRGHPALRAVYTSSPGEANLARTVVVMPKNELLDNSHIGNVCSRVQFAANACPADSVYGSATAETPLLDEPLTGPVYLRSSSHRLPDLVVDLEGQIDIELAARIDATKSGSLRARFEAVPDAPVTKFVLDMQGGAKGLLINSKPVCKADRRASVRLVGQNDELITRRPNLKAACGSKTSRHKRGKLARLFRSRAVR
jgi:hypothetical protein